jgi:hypothetical protein
MEIGKLYRKNHQDNTLGYCLNIMRVHRTAIIYWLWPPYHLADGSREEHIGNLRPFVPEQFYGLDSNNRRSLIRHFFMNFPRAVKNNP